MFKKIIKIKLTQKRIICFSYIFIIGFSIIMFGSVTAFLYKNFYQTITQSKEIMILRQSVVIETVNIEKFNKIMERLAQKTRIENLKNLNNPFN